MLWDVKHVQHDIPQSTTIHGNIWTLEVGCNPVGKRSRRFYGRRLNTSKSKIRPFTKNQVLKIYRHQANTRSWKNFYTWPGFVTTFTKLSSHYGWSLHHKAEQPLRMTTTSQGWAAITVDHYTHTHTHTQSWAVITVDHYITRLGSLYGWSLQTHIKLSSHYGWSLYHKAGQSLRLITTHTHKAEQSLRLITISQGWAVFTVDHYTHT